MSAAVTLPAMISSHMVLQREQPIHIWGWADPQETVTVEFHSTQQTAIGNRIGRWDVYLPPQAAGGPYTMTVKGASTIQLEDVMVGDVWFASGQSNMEMPLAGFPNSAVVTNADEEIRNANRPNLRLLMIHKKTSDFPVRDFEPTAWTACTPETAAKFSAVAYFFGRDLAEKEHVTIGLIDSTWGGTPGEAWISMHGLSSDAALMPVFSQWASFADGQTELAAAEESEKREDEAARKANRPLTPHAWHPNPGSWQPAALYNGMVAPATEFRIKGAIWYQGESNAGGGRANLYEKVLPALIADWRTNWHEGNFPFLFVQLANFKTGGETWPIVREAQRRTLAVAHTGMAVAIDIGDPINIHPSNKQDVGARLALAARKIAYGEHELEDSGPLFRETTVEGHALRIWFDHTTGGLAAKGDGMLTGFEVASDDHRFMNASARIDGNSVVVSCDGIGAPKYVRYGWANAPAVNLVNGKGLPASPFTSEDQIPQP